MIWHILIWGSVSVYGRCVIGLLSVWVRDCRFWHCTNDRFSIGAMSVIYRSQIGRFHTESYPKWSRHEPDWFYGIFGNIVGGRQLADSFKILRFLSVSCRFARCDWGIRPTNRLPSVAELRPIHPRTIPDKTDTTPIYNRQTTDNLSGIDPSNMFERSHPDKFVCPNIKTTPNGQNRIDTDC